MARTDNCGLPTFVLSVLLVLSVLSAGAATFVTPPTGSGGGTVAAGNGVTITTNGTVYTIDAIGGASTNAQPQSATLSNVAARGALTLSNANVGFLSSAGAYTDKIAGDMVPGTSNAFNQGSWLLPWGTNWANEVYAMENVVAASNLVSTGLRFLQVTNPTAPVATLILAAGNVNAGTHVYRITYVTPTGETEMSDISNTVSNDATHGQTSITLPISVNPLVTARRIYRTRANITVQAEITLVCLLATVSDNTTASYTDNTADSGMSTDTYGIFDNTTGGNIYVNNVKSGMIGHRWTTAFGYGALENNTGGGGNTAFGSYVLNQNTEGRFNQGFGYLVLRDNTVGGYNTAAGDVSMTHNISGHGNAAYGYQTLQDSTNGYYNSAFGYAALQTFTGYTVADVGNVGVGAYALFNLKRGSNNIALGTESIYTATNGGSLIGIGYGALRYGVTGYRNIGIGDSAGTSNAATYNVFVGPLSGYSSRTADRQVFIGPSAGYYETGSDKLFIDNRSHVNEADARTNTLVYGVMANTVADQVFAVNGNVGIGMVGPVVPLHIRNRSGVNPFTGIRIDNTIGGVGTLARLGFSDTLGSDLDHAWVQSIYDGTGMCLQFGTGAGWVTGTARMHITSDGKVGIGTTVPATSLDVTGGVSAASGIFSNSVTITAANGSLFIAGTARLNSSADGTLTLWNNGNTDFTALQFGGTGASAPAIARASAGSGHLKVANGPVNLTTATNALWFQGANAFTQATNAIVNQQAGKVNLTIGHSFYYITNSLVTTNSILLATLNSTPDSERLIAAVPLNGVIRLEMSAAWSTSAGGNISWFIVSP